LALLWGALTPSPAQAADLDLPPSISAASDGLSPPPPPVIQNRKHRLRVELSLGAALLPSDAYSKEIGLDAGLRYHFSDLLAWEIAHFHTYLDWRSGLRAQLEDNFGVPPQRFPILRYALDTNFVVSPVYAKLALLNGRLLYLQLYALIGAGAGLVQGGEPEPGSTDPGRGLHVAALADIGLGVRAWMSQRWSLRYELRQYISIDTATSEVTPSLFMSLSVAVSLGGAR
jgi:outer membrane beta-barrel protein